MCDDDTYVFYHNLYWYLQELDPKEPVYTGDVIPDSWIPVMREDGSPEVMGSSLAMRGMQRTLGTTILTRG